MNEQANHPTSDEAASTGGRQLWRGLEELAADSAMQDWVRREFPEGAGDWSDPVTRRRFLTLMGASFALAGLSGCSSQPAPEERIVPYVRQPDGVTPGKSLYYATTMTLAGTALGLLVESREGRPIKVEGNPLHPASLGATDVFAQAAVLSLYDPERSQALTYRGKPRSWDETLSVLRSELARQRRRRGAGLRILTETVLSPTLADQLTGDHAGAMRVEFPEAKWHQYDAVNRDQALRGAQLAYGRAVSSHYRVKDADVILCLDADLLGSGPAHLRYVHEFSQRRHVEGDPQRATMNRLYVVESAPSITGAKADHRLAVRASDIEAFSRALAVELARQLRGRPGGGERETAALALLNRVRASPTAASIPEKWLRTVVADLLRSSSLIVAGDGQSPFVHALVHAMNQALGNVGRTVVYTGPVEARPIDQQADLAELVDDMKAGRVELLVILGGNPVYTAPADLEFTRHMQKVPLRVHLGLYQDETAVQCHWHIPAAHFLEAWSDARAFDGTVSLTQPLIAPLYGGHSAHELLSALFEGAARPGQQIVRDYWREHWPTFASNFEQAGEQAVHDGIIADSAFGAQTNLSLRSEWVDQAPTEPTPAEELEIVFRPDPTLFDGRFANNGWLQELPKPLTQLTWDNAAIMGPATAARFQFTIKPGWHGGEHGEAIVDMVEITFAERVVEAPVWIQPGMPEGAILVYLGHGRTRAGTVGNRTGFNAYALRSTSAPWHGHGITLRPLGKPYTLACTQMHHAMEGRDPVKAATLEQYRRDHDFAHKSAHEHDTSKDRRLIPLSLYPERDYSPPRNRWGMSIDLAACVGCNACVVACQAENNIPVVGKNEVTRGREMHWLRVDRYFAGDPDDASNLKTYFQPVPCMHCENAPCELVCPVAATVHSADGLNDMVYNRCVGTRYCSNNCPYKVRRFNFLEYADYATASLKLGRNPEVTVRSRGVMEKCTYCVQRIRAAQIDAEVSGTPIRDGDVLTACQAVCPAQAIVFGDMNDPKSIVARRKAESLEYGLLAELNTKPRTTYRAALRNPNPELL